MSHLLDEILAQAANGSPTTVALSAESVAVLLFGSEFLSERPNWLDKSFSLLDEVTDADWDEIEKLVGNAYEEIMTPVLAVGSIQLWGTGTPPDNWLLCDGAQVSRADYAELFALWGTTFGNGDGSTTFNLPDFSDRSPMGVGTLATAIGNTTGSSNEILTTAQIPAHNHGVTDPGHVHTVTDPGHRHDQRVGADLPAFRALGGTGNTGYGSATSSSTTRQNTDSNTTGVSIQSHTTGVSIDNAGGGGPHNNVHPVLGINFIVYAVQP